MKKPILSLMAVAAMAVFSAAAQADGLSANVSLVTKYKFRGQDQADPSKEMVPALQGGFDYSLGGFYAGNWNSAIGFGHGTEMDFYGGYKGKISMFDYDVGLLQYYYPGSGASGLNTTEIYGQLGWNVFTAKYSLTVSNDYFGIANGSNTGYLEANANAQLIDKLTLNAHVAQTMFSGGAKAAGAVNYMDYRVGVTYDLGQGFSVAGAYAGATKKSAWVTPSGISVNKDRLIFTLSKTM